MFVIGRYPAKLKLFSLGVTTDDTWIFLSVSDPKPNCDSECSDCGEKFANAPYFLLLPLEAQIQLKFDQKKFEKRELIALSCAKARMISKSIHWKILRLTSQGTEVLLKWQPVIASQSSKMEKNSSKNHRQLFRPHLGSSVWYTSMMASWMTVFTY